MAYYEKKHPAEAFYSGQGFKIPQILDYSGLALMVGSTNKLNYINLSLPFLSSPSLRFGKPWIGLGPYIGYLLNGKMLGDGGKVNPIIVGTNNSPCHLPGPTQQKIA